MTARPAELRLAVAGLLAVLALAAYTVVVLAGYVGTLSSEVAAMRSEQAVAHPPSGRAVQDRATPAPHEASAAKLVYICQITEHCRDSQELEVFDRNSAPIFSVAAYGGAAVFGDSLTVFPPGTVDQGAGLTKVTDHGRHGWLVQSYEPPSDYATGHPGSPAGCTAPSLWVAPQGFWHCSTAGRWVPGP